MSTAGPIVWNYASTSTISYVPTGGLSTGQVRTNQDENIIADLEDELVQAGEQIEALEAQVYEVRLLLARMWMGDMPSDDELAEHLEAVAEEFG